MQIYKIHIVNLLYIYYIIFIISHALVNFQQKFVMIHVGLGYDNSILTVRPSIFYLLVSTMMEILNVGFRKHTSKPLRHT